MHKSGKDKMELDRRRDAQQWVLDYVIAKTGREQNFENPGRRFPETVKSYRMIPRVLFKEGEHLEKLARGADDAGHALTARRLYFKAVQTYRHAQHSIFTDDHPEKLFLYGRMTECFDRIIALSDGRLERVEVPWEDSTLSGVFHRAPGPDPKPTVMFFPGMDMSKEAFPDPDDNPFAPRGMNILSIDGPGQGASNLRKIHVTEDNYERAAGVFFAHLLERDDVEASKIAVAGFSMGSYWGTRVAAAEPRFRACALSGVCVEPGQYTIFNTASPTFKLNYMYMSGYDDEAAFDEFAKTLTLHEVAGKITCSYLVVAGEDDELCSIDFVYHLMERISAPKVLIVYEGERHSIRNPRARTQIVNWLTDRLEGKPFKAEKIYVEMSGKEVHTPW